MSVYLFLSAEMIGLLKPTSLTSFTKEKKQLHSIACQSIEEQRVWSMRRKNAQEIFSLLNKFSFSYVRSGVSFLFLFVLLLSLSLSPKRINHRETIADDLNEWNLLWRSSVIGIKKKEKESKYAIIQMRSSLDRCLTIRIDNQFTS